MVMLCLVRVVGNGQEAKPNDSQAPDSCNPVAGKSAEVLPISLEYNLPHSSFSPRASFIT